MKSGPFAVTIACGLVAACSGPDQPSFDTMLVERFDVPECTSVRPLKMAGLREGDDHKVRREYSADAGCTSALEEAALSLDFQEELAGTFIARRTQGWTETLVIGRQDGASKTNVVWEEVNP